MHLAFILALTVALLLSPAASLTAQTGMFSVGDQQLYLHCDGQRHGPAVILDAGLYRTSKDWHLVQPEVARYTQVCSYDRRGLGRSLLPGQKEAEPGCVDSKVSDLRNLLRSARVPPPYILVGHSAAGIRIRRYVRDFPDEIAGLVFVDSAHEEQTWRFQEIDPNSVQGPPANPENVKCGGGLPATGDRLVWHTDKPLIVLEHGIPLSFTGPLAEHTAEFNAAVDSMARDLASRSSQAQFRVAKKSGHDIMLDQPDLVNTAIHNIWTKTR